MMTKRSILWGVSVVISVLVYGTIAQWTTDMSQYDQDVLMARVGTFGLTFLLFVHTLGMLVTGAWIYHKVISGSLDASRFRLNNSRMQLNNTRRDQIRYKMLETFFGLSNDIVDIPQMASDPEAVDILPSKQHALSSGQYYTIDDMTDSEDDFNFSDFETDLE
jgi:hypothetical protein